METNVASIHTDGFERHQPFQHQPDGWITTSQLVTTWWLD